VAALSVVDASVVIALRDRDDAHHEGAMRAVGDARQAGQVVLPASALAESLVHPLAAGVDVTEALDKLLAVFRVEPLSAEIAVAAAGLRAGSPPVRLPDALVLATGIQLDADQVLTCDRRWRRIDPRVKLIEPTRP
jgi:predicted nucleic acid-binding protein